jgi:hypothetical protein
MTHDFQWTAGHSPALWPDSDWGLEIGLSLYNDDACQGQSYSSGWWASPTTYEWATNLPPTSEPYLDDDRAFDVCGRLAEAFGIGHPERITPSAATYVFAISATNLGYKASSPFGADMQIVSNDCNNLGASAGSWCMGLNTARPFTYGQQSQVLVNRNRGAQVPGCARMYVGWQAPGLWPNRSTALLPAPLNYWESCLANDF